MTEGHQEQIKVNTSWAVVGNLFYVGGRIAIIMVLTHLFESALVGQVLFALAVVTPLAYLINLELRSVFVTDAQGRINVGDCLSYRLFSNIFLLMVLGGLCIYAGSRWGGSQCVIILLMGGVRSVESWADVYLGIFQKRERMKYWAISQICKTGLVFLWVLLLPLWTEWIGWMPVGWMLGTLLVLWFYDRVRAGHLSEIRMRWERRCWGRLIGGGLPLGIFVTLAILNQQVGQYFIKQALGDSKVAYFGVFMMYVSGMATVQNGVNQALLGRMTIYFMEDITVFLKLVGRLLVGSWLVMAVGLAVVGWQGEVILRWINGEEYARYAGLFFWMVLAGCVLLTGMILGDAIIACHRFKSRMIAVGVGLAVNVLICRFYMEAYGLAAAVWAALVSSVVTTLGYLVVLMGVVINQRRGGKRIYRT